METYKKSHRKVCAFYTIQLLICAPTAFKDGITWPLAALSGGVFLFFVSGIWAEKAVLAWLQKGGNKHEPI